MTTYKTSLYLDRENTKKVKDKGLNISTIVKIFLEKLANNVFTMTDIYENRVGANGSAEELKLLNQQLEYKNTQNRQQVDMLSKSNKDKFKFKKDFMKYRKITLSLLNGENISEDDYAYLTRDY